jgi:PhnB protein
MASVSTYLNFNGTTEAAFLFYAKVFGTEFSMPIFKMGDAPPMDGMPPVPDELKNMVMNVQLPILAGHVLMGTDAHESMGHHLTIGNNSSINLTTDTRAELDRLYAELSAGGTDCQDLQDMFWGAYFGSCQDQFGTRWMFNCYEPAAAA